METHARKGLPLTPDGKVDYKAIRKANRAREHIKAVKTEPHGNRKLSLLDTAVIEWRNKVLGESHAFLAEEYGVSVDTIRKNVIELRKLGGISIIGKGEMAQLFPEGIDAALNKGAHSDDNKGGNGGGQQVLSSE